MLDYVITHCGSWGPSTLFLSSLYTDNQIHPPEQIAPLPPTFTMEKTSLPPSTSTPINPTDVINQDTKVWWDCYEAIWEQLNYVHAIEEPNIKAFVNWPNWAAVIHSCLEELVSHQWASLGGELIPQDLEVLERGKLWSGDVPEGIQDVGQSVLKILDRPGLKPGTPNTLGLVHYHCATSPTVQDVDSTTSRFQQSVGKGKGKDIVVSVDTVPAMDKTSRDIQESSNTPSQVDGPYVIPKEPKRTNHSSTITMMPMVLQW
ncbi:hypothetical protein EDC04DRAFT_2609864 [Pisolithus marmoratus]|nr:hypothetical protein EDC04DRAFT_2609864 [Pisolithus marmoratus]